MLRFFRHIRQRLLNENRVVKYLLYAIGEILLVVIGILIALQVDNWNQKRQEVDRIKAQLENVVQDLKADRRALQRLHSFHAYRVHAAYYLIHQFNPKEIVKAYPEAGPIPELDETGLFSGPVPDSLDRIFVERGFSWLLRSNPVRPSTDAIDEFKGTGLYALFENQEIKNGLRTYYMMFAFTFPRDEVGEPNTTLLRNSFASMGYSYLDVYTLEDPVHQLLSNPTNVALIKNIIDESTYRSNQASSILNFLEELILIIENEIDNYPSN